MFYTRSNGMRVPATVVGFAPDGLLHLEYFQDAVKVVNRQCKVESISFAIPSADSPPTHRWQVFGAVTGVNTVITGAVRALCARCAKTPP